MSHNKYYQQHQLERLNEVISQHFKHLSIIQKNFKLTMEGLPRLVMLDRYSQKDEKKKTLEVGDVVLVTIKFDPKFPSKGIGLIKEKLNNGEEWVIEIEKEFEDNVESSLLLNLNSREIIKKRSEITKSLELFYEQIAWRVSKEISNQENSKELKQKSFNEFYEQIKSFKIVPAGRVLFGAGSKSNVTYFNCFVMPFVKDSREGIANHRKEVMEIMSRGGGVGTNGSCLRPKNSSVSGVNGRTSGSVSWLNDISSLTNLVESGGTRRGAQMIMLSDWHPDIIEFIIAKIQNKFALQELLKKSKDKKIIEEVKNKLEFVELSKKERKLGEFFLKNNPNQIEFKELESELREGGYWKVRDSEFLTGLT